MRAKKAAAGPTTTDEHAVAEGRVPAPPHTVTEAAMLMLQDAALLESILLSVPVDLALFRPLPRSQPTKAQ